MGEEGRGGWVGGEGWGRREGVGEEGRGGEDVGWGGGEGWGRRGGVG